MVGLRGRRNPTTLVYGEVFMGANFRNVERHVITGAANAPVTLSTPGGRIRQLLYVAVKYSGVPVQSGVTVTLNSGAGAAYDTVLSTGAANAQNTAYIVPDSNVFTTDDDVIDILAPAGGVGLTASISAYTEVLE